MMRLVLLKHIGCGLISWLLLIMDRLASGVRIFLRGMGHMETMRLLVCSVLMVVTAILGRKYCLTLMLRGEWQSLQHQILGLVGLTL